MAAASHLLRRTASRSPSKVTRTRRAAAPVVARHEKRARRRAGNAQWLLAFASSHRHRPRSPVARAANRQPCHSLRGPVAVCIAPPASSNAGSRANDRLRVPARRDRDVVSPYMSDGRLDEDRSATVRTAAARQLWSSTFGRAAACDAAGTKADPRHVPAGQLARALAKRAGGMLPLPHGMCHTAVAGLPVPQDRCPHRTFLTEPCIFRPARASRRAVCDLRREPSYDVG